MAKTPKTPKPNPNNPPANTPPKKRAYRRVVRRANGIGLRVAFFDAETGQEITDLTGYEILDQGSPSDIGQGGTTPPRDDDDDDDRKGGRSSGGGRESSVGDPYVNPFTGTTTSGKPIFKDESDFWEAIRDFVPPGFRVIGDHIAGREPSFRQQYEEKVGIKKKPPIEQAIDFVFGGGDKKKAPAQTPTTPSSPSVNPTDDLQQAGPTTSTPTDIGMGSSGPNAVPSKRVQYASNITHRTLPVSKDYEEMISAAVYNVDPKLKITITSGGQTAKGSPFTNAEGQTYDDRTRPPGASDRHNIDDSGFTNTADFYLHYGDGKPIPLTGQTRQLYLEVAKNAAALGFTGIGHYENMNFIHVGMGEEAAWGPNGKSDTLASDFNSAIKEGRQLFRKGYGNELLRNYQVGAHQETFGPLGADPRVNMQAGSLPAAAKTSAFSAPTGAKARDYEIADINPKLQEVMSNFSSIGSMPNFNDVAGVGSRATAGTEYIRPDGSSVMHPVAGSNENPIPRPAAVGPDPNSRGAKSRDYEMATQKTVNFEDIWPSGSSPQLSDDFMKTFNSPATPKPTTMGGAKAKDYEIGNPPATNYSILDPERERKIVQTMLGEEPLYKDGALNVLGLSAVAHTFLNRAKQGGIYPDDPGMVATQKFPGAKVHQYSPWNDPGNQGNNPDKRFPVGSPEYLKALEIARGVFAGTIPDPTFGATHFHTPDTKPSWSKSPSINKYGAIQIGSHLYYPNVPPPPTPATNTARMSQIGGSQVTSMIPGVGDMFKVASAPKASMQSPSSSSSDIGSMPSFGQVSGFMSRPSSSSSSSTPEKSTYVNQPATTMSAADKASSTKSTSTAEKSTYVNQPSSGFMSGPSSPAPRPTSSTGSSGGGGTSSAPRPSSPSSSSGGGTSSAPRPSSTPSSSTTSKPVQTSSFGTTYQPGGR
jgi:hypothetical protein